MNSIGIITDSLIQFPSPIFEGRELISIIDFDLSARQGIILSSEESRDCVYPQNLFVNYKFQNTPILKSPSIEKIAKKIETLSLKNEYIFCLTSSSKLTNIYKNFLSAIEMTGLQSKTFLIDSKSISLGQGMLCQLLIKLTQKELTIQKILQSIREETNNIYSIFFLKNFSYLYRSNILPYPSAVLAEMKSIKQSFILENGFIYSAEKAKSIKNIIDIFENYANEFEDIKMMSILQSKPPMDKITQPFKERIKEKPFALSIHEQIINPYLTSLIGPQSTGIFFYEPSFF